MELRSIHIHIHIHPPHPHPPTHNTPTRWSSGAGGASRAACARPIPAAPSRPSASPPRAAGTAAAPPARLPPGRSGSCTRRTARSTPPGALRCCRTAPSPRYGLGAEGGGRCVGLGVEAWGLGFRRGKMACEFGVWGLVFRRGTRVCEGWGKGLVGRLGCVCWSLSDESSPLFRVQGLGFRVALVACVGLSRTNLRLCCAS